MPGIPTVQDRVIQQAIVQVLTPIFDPEFSNSSFGYRPGRSAHDAVQQVKRYIKQGLHQAVDVDLSQFFDTVSHDVLMSKVARKINDKRLLKWIGRYFRAGVMIDGQCYPTRVEGWRKTSPYPIFIVFLAIECFPVRRFLNLDQIKRTCRSVWKFLRRNDDLLISDHHDVDFELPGEEALETFTPGVDPVTVPHSLGNTGQVD